MRADSRQLRQITSPDAVTPALREELIACWAAVANAGGAVGFAFPPVDVEQVAPVADDLIAGLCPERSRLLLALGEDRLVGWLHLLRHADPLVAHWGVVKRVQTHPDSRGRGYGRALMRRVAEIARQEWGLEQLRLDVRGGAGLEAFYEALGWQEIGRWPAALRFGPGDDRDEVLMLLPLTSSPVA